MKLKLYSINFVPYSIFYILKPKALAQLVNPPAGGFLSAPARFATNSKQLLSGNMVLEEPPIFPIHHRSKTLVFQNLDLAFYPDEID